jgi:hypothetical protein
MLWKDASQAPDYSVWLGILLSALAGYGAMSFMLALISAYGVTLTEILKTMRKVLQVCSTFQYIALPLPVACLSLGWVWRRYG